VRRGDRVKLAPNIAESLMKGYPHDKRSVNWLTRRGLVVRVSAPTDTVTIKWDDRATIDFWPARALEMAREDETGQGSLPYAKPSEFVQTFRCQGARWVATQRKAIQQTFVGLVIPSAVHKPTSARPDADNPR
jgi:hypothetical protein